MPGNFGSPNIVPCLISSASSRTNPGGTGCLYCPEADTVSNSTATARPVHFSAFASSITSPLEQNRRPQRTQNFLQKKGTLGRCARSEIGERERRQRGAGR